MSLLQGCVVLTGKPDTLHDSQAGTVCTAPANYKDLYGESRGRLRPPAGCFYRFRPNPFVHQCHAHHVCLIPAGGQFFPYDTTKGASESLREPIGYLNGTLWFDNKPRIFGDVQNDINHEREKRPANVLGVRTFAGRSSKWSLFIWKCVEHFESF